MLDVDAPNRSDPFREVEDLRLAERLRGAPRTVRVLLVLLPHHGRVEALLDRGPDGERQSEVVAVDGEVRTVAHAELVDLTEEVVGGVPGQHVGQSGLHADADQGQSAGALPVPRSSELFSPSVTPGSVYGDSGCGRDRLIAMSR